jgi:3-phenylpropionate/trans-cinnamate dioxygenase ferredoxin reductase subunit
MIVSNERELPYHRPPLSKAFLKQQAHGSDPQLDLPHLPIPLSKVLVPQLPARSDPLKGAAFYESRKIELELGVSVVSVSLAKTASLSNGMQISFDHLLLAVGAAARTLTCCGRSKMPATSRPQRRVRTMSS